MSDDLVKRLLVDARFCEASGRPGDAGIAALLREAAERIEALSPPAPPPWCSPENLGRMGDQR
ncbi:MAG TPA: hypothetical protein VEB39_02125 [Sphingomicrobium sp.]|nr:hypothetical protein [Sphingomicrobium sp.]